MSSYSQSALVLAAHGSTVNTESKQPTLCHAAEIRYRYDFAEVRVCFWKEKPFFKEILDQICSERVYIVPNFISQGYFTQEILPREFQLQGAVSRIRGKEVFYCDPVGLHPSMTRVLMQKADYFIDRDELDPKQVTVLIAGHGTPKNKNSTRIIYDQVEAITKMECYGECQAIFMEEPPFVKDWSSLSSFENVIVVPFFISDGLHSYEDIPVMLGISSDVRKEGFSNPTAIEKKKIWYANAVGTGSKMVEVIMSQVRKFEPPSHEDVVG